MMMKKVLLSSVMTIIFFSHSAMAGGGGVGACNGPCGSEYTQILNSIQLADSFSQDALRFQNEILRYEVMLKNLADNPLGVTGPNLQLLVDNQAKIMAYGSSIGQSMSQVDKNVAKAFNNPTATSFGVKFGIAANIALDQLRTAMLDHGLQHDNAQSDSANIQKLVDKVRQSGGDKGAIQALGELNAAQLQEAQQYRQLFSEQSQAVNMAMGADIAAKRDAQAQSDAVKTGFNDPPIGATAKLPSARTSYKTLDLFK